MTLSKAEPEFMQKFKAGELTVELGTPIFMEGSNTPQFFAVLSGMGIRVKQLGNGERQVISFVSPGDFIGLQTGIKGEMGHSLEARNQMRLCVFDRTLQINELEAPVEIAHMSIEKPRHHPLM